MDTVIFTGRMPLEEFREDKTSEYEALSEERPPRGALVEPLPPIVIRAVRAFGWTALTPGFAIVLWITYSMVFAYRRTAGESRRMRLRHQEALAPALRRGRFSYS